ncbi:MAG: tetratricopeptide repeat protein [Fimbriimonadales bacterium]
MDTLDPSQEEIQAALRKAHVLRNRGDTQGADAAVAEVLEKHPDHPASQEVKADILASQGKLSEARDILAAIVARQPGNIAAERKHAQVVLRIAEKDMAVSQALSGDLSHAAGARRSSTTAAFCSLMLPGFGQIYNGEMGKGISIAAVAVLLWVGLFTIGMEDVGGRSQPSAFFWPIMVGIATLYIVSLIDASVTAGRMSPSGRIERPVPPVDKPFE